MKPLRITLSAFGPYASETVISFEAVQSGLFLIAGETGSGKTILFDALMFALFDDTSGTSRGNSSLRSDFAGPETETFVELTFELRSLLYTVRRSPRYSRPKRSGTGMTEQNPAVSLTLPDGRILSAKSEVDQKIRELIGLDKEQFRQVVMIAQGAFFDLIETSSKDRAAIYRKLFNTTPYRAMQDHLADLYRKAREQSRIHSSRLMLDLRRFPLPDWAGDLEEGREKLLDQDAIWPLEAFIPKLQDLVDSLEKEGRGADGRLAASRLRLKEAEASLVSLQKGNRLLDQLDRALEEEKKLLEGQPLYLEKAGRLESAQEAMRKVTLPFQNRGAARERLKAARASRQDADRALGEALAAQKEADSLLEEAAASQEILEALPARLASLKKEQEDTRLRAQLESSLKEEEERASALAAGLEKLAGQAQELEEARAKRTEALELLSDAQERLGQAENQVKEAGETVRQVEDLAAAAGRLLEEGSRLEGERALLEENLTSWQKLDGQAKEASELLFRERAGLLAQELEEGQACPVCGSVEHPQKAVRSPEAPTKEAVDQLMQEAEASRQALEEESRRLAVCRKGLDLESREAGQAAGRYLDDLSAVKAWDRDFMEVLASRLSVRLEEAILQEIHAKELAAGEAERLALRKQLLLQEEADLKKSQDLLGQREDLDRQKAARREAIALIRGQLTGLGPAAHDRDEQALDRELEEANLLHQTLKQALDLARTRDREASQALAAAKARQSSLDSQILTLEEELSAFEEALTCALAQASLASEDHYLAVLISEEERAELTEWIRIQGQAREANKAEIFRLRQECQGLVRGDEEDLEAAIGELAGQAVRDEEEAREGVTRYEIARKALEAIRGSLALAIQSADEEDSLKDLSDLASGQHREADQITFETYIQTWYFAQVIRQANQRLTQMTGGRYRLRRTQEARSRQARTGLDLSVEDLWNAKDRPVSSLSGGEKFQTVLSLALGLSDVVMAQAGGVEINSLFIDEGFGSLDDQSLEEAMGVLQDLAADNRMIGLISHLPLLKQAIDRKLLAKKGAGGSSIGWI